MFSAIAKPFGWLMMWLYDLLNNYGLALIAFALIVKIILLPFQMKSKRGSMRQARLMPKMKEIEKKHGGNKQKYNEEVAKLYKESGVNPMSGCLWSLIPFPILIALYEAIRYPLTVMMGVAQDLLNEGGLIANKLAELGFTSTMNAGYVQIEQSQFITQHWDQFSQLGVENLQPIDYTFLGLDLGAKPQLSALGNINWSDGATIAAAALLLIPVLAGVFTFIQSKISMKVNAVDGEKPAGMGGMTIIMPLITVWFAYMMPAGLGVYWIAGNIFAIAQELILTPYYKKKLDAEEAVLEAKRIEKEKELEAKRKETERLKAENATKRNENTSKKKLHLTERESKRGKAAEWAKKKAGVETEDEPSRVGDRKYARGRAYDPDRYKPGHIPAEPPEETEEKTESAAAEIPESSEAVEAEEVKEETAPADEKETPEEKSTEETSAEEESFLEEDPLAKAEAAGDSIINDMGGDAEEKKEETESND